MEFGDILRQKRLKMGWTQQELGDRVGKSKNNISQYELGKREPDYDVLSKFIRLFQTTADEILGLSPVHNVLRENAPAWGQYLDAQPRLLPVYALLPNAASIAERLAPGECEDNAVYYFCYAPDNAMSGDRILQGDLLLIRQDDSCPDNTLSLISYNGAGMLRRVTKTGSGMYLLAASNSAYPAMLVKKRELKIFGIVRQVLFAL